MLLTISTDREPATDLGHLLGKNPDRCHSITLPFGKAHVFYPVSSDTECTAAVLLDVDTVRFGRDSRSRANEPKVLANYVNDRAYVSSTLMSVALARVFAGAMKGESRDRQKLVDTPIPLTATLSAVRSREGEDLIRRVFEPLGYSVEAEQLSFEPSIRGGGPSPYYSLVLRGSVRLRDLLAHLHLVLPVVDDDGEADIVDDEIRKSLAKPVGWLKAHPERERIVHRHLRPPRRAVPEALARLVSDEELDLASVDDENARLEAALEAPLELSKLRARGIVAALRAAGARRVLDLGCGDADVLRAIFLDLFFERVAGVDVSQRALERSTARLGIERLSPQAQSRIGLFVGSPLYRDLRFLGYDAVCLVEVLEHTDLDRLPALERVVFEATAPPTVLVTTPNADFNPRLGLGAGSLRHRDHRFEWTRAAFESWATETAARFSYRVKVTPLGPVDPQLGAPTQMAVFSR